MAKKIVVYEGKSFEIAYEIGNFNQKEVIVFLHGWGSNKEIMQEAFKDCFTKFRHLYIDLPGFGKSLNEEVITTRDYAEILKLFFKALEIEPKWIVGHSFGGKIATLLNPQELILLSSAGIVCPKSLGVRSKIFLAKSMRWLGIGALGKRLRSQDANGLNEAMYEVFKKVVDEDFSPIFSQCTSRAWIFWGIQDSATPLSSGEKISTLIKNNHFFAFKGDHFFFLHQGKEIENHILGEMG